MQSLTHLPPHPRPHRLRALCLVAMLIWIALPLASCSRTSSGIRRPVLTPTRLAEFTQWGEVWFAVRLSGDSSSSFLLRVVDLENERAGSTRLDSLKLTGPLPAGVLKPAGGLPVFAFDASLAHLVPSTPEAWEAAATPIYLGGLLGPTAGQDGKAQAAIDLYVKPWSWPADVLQTWPKDGTPLGGSRLYFNGVNIGLPEPYFASRCWSPCLRYLAVSSRDGKLVGSVWGNAKDVDGYHYVSMYDAATGKQITDTYPVGSVRLEHKLAWTPDSKYLLIFDTPFYRFDMFVLPNPALTSAQPRTAP